MIKRFISLFKQDLKIAFFRNNFLYVVLGLAVLLIIVINFIVPESVKITPNELVVDNTQGKVLENHLLSQGFDKDKLYEDEESLKAALDKNNNTIGIIMSGTLENTKITVLYQGTESKESLNLLNATLEEILNQLRGKTQQNNFKVQYLREKTKPIPFNKGLLPIMIVTEAIMLGFLLIAVMVFQEKEEGSVRAYRISPGGAFEYVLSKTIVNVLLGLIYSGVMAIFTMGFKVDYLSMFLIIALASMLMTLIGLSVSVFFHNLQEFLFVGVFIIAVTGIPIASYLTPSFAPSYISVIPSYPILFGLREVFFPTGKTGFISSLNLMLAGEIAVFLVISLLAVNKKLMKEGK